MGPGLDRHVGAAGFDDLLGAVAQVVDLAQTALGQKPLHVDDAVVAPTVRRRHIGQQVQAVGEKIGVPAQVIGNGVARNVIGRGLIVVDGGFVGFASHGLQKPRDGPRIAYYTPETGFQSGTPQRRP